MCHLLSKPYQSQGLSQFLRSLSTDGRLQTCVAIFSQARPGRTKDAFHTKKEDILHQIQCLIFKNVSTRTRFIENLMNEDSTSELDVLTLKMDLNTALSQSFHVLYLWRYGTKM